MAYVDSFLTQSSTTGATSYALTLPDHVANDVIVVCVSADAGVSTLSASGWTQVGTTQTSTGHVAAVFYKRAASSAETCTITCGVADAIHVHMIILKDVNTTTALDASSVTNNATATEVTCGSITTTTADCLLLYYLALDQNTAGVPSMAHSRPGPSATMHFLDSSDNGGTTVTTQAAGAIGWYYQRSTGGTPQPVWDIAATELTTSFVMAFRNVSGGKIPPYVDDYAENGRQLMTGTWWASATTRNNQNFKATPLTYARVGSYLATTSASGTGTVATIGFATQSYPPFTVGQSITVAGVTPAGYNATAIVTACTTSSVSYANATTGAQTVAGTISQYPTTFDAAAVVADAGLNPYSYALNSTPLASTTNCGGFECGFPTTAHDMSTGWIVGVFHGSTNKMAAFNQGSIKQGGGYLTIGQGASNWRTYNVMARDNQDGYGKDFTIISVQANQQETAIGWSATQPTITAIDKILITNRGHNATGAFYYADFHLFKKLILSGGDATYPVDSAAIAAIATFCRVPVVRKLGASELTAYVPIQVGGGDAVNFQVDAGALQFPRIYDRTKKEINYHGSSGSIGISYAGKSGDVIKHTNSVVTSASLYYWEINSAATNAATWDFTGLVVVNANVTLRPVMTFSDMAFSNCAYVATTGSTIQNCKFSNTLVTCSSPANAALVSNCTFAKTSGTKHAIEITGTAANITLTGNTFTGYASSNGSTGNEAIYVNIASGSMTISISGGSTPSIRTAGATVTVSNPVNFYVTNIIDGTEVRIYKQSDLSELGGAENVGASPSGLNNVTVDSDPDNAGRYRVTYAYNYVSDVPVYVVVFHNSYQALRPAFTLKSTNSSLQVAQNTDRQYYNPA